jgi:hypothetical protein
MARTNVLLSQLAVTQVLGEARLKRLLRAKWLAPQPRANGKVFYASQDLRAAIRRLERGEWLEPDTIEVARVRDSERRHGRGYVRKTIDKGISDLNELCLDELR